MEDTTLAVGLYNNLKTRYLSKIAEASSLDTEQMRERGGCQRNGLLTCGAQAEPKSWVGS